MEKLKHLALESLQRRNPLEALNLLKTAIKKNKGDAILYNYRGIAQCQLGNLDDGIRSYQKALKLEPKSGEFYCNLGTAFAQKQKTDQALTCFQKAIALNFKSPLLYYNVANILHQHAKIEQAIGHYQAALELNPTNLTIAYNLLDCLEQQKDYEEIKRIHEQILRYYPSDIRAHKSLALIYHHQKNYAEAIKHLEPLHNELDEKLILILTSCYNAKNKFLATLNLALKYYNPDKPSVELLSHMILAAREICHWDGIEEWIALFVELIKPADGLLPNNIHLRLGYPPEYELIFSQKIAAYIENKTQQLKDTCNFSFIKKKKEKLRIGYVSSDIRNHAASHLMRRMFFHHAKNEFEIYLYSKGPTDDSFYAVSLKETADSFKDLFQQSPDVSAKLIYDDHIDILIDVSLYNLFSPSEILSLRPAPIQISFLGFCGTSAADFMDYLVTDPTCITTKERPYHSEQLIVMPHTYFVTDDEPPVRENKPRAHYHLPAEENFIFGSFNNTAKLNRELFSIWMRILKQVQGSKLWLLLSCDEAKNNLLKEAHQAGISSDRIIFAKALEKGEHLARLSHINLFLDSFLYGAHTTAIDALWMGVPILTCYGNNIASRAASGILTAIHLPELITYTHEEYEHKAIHLATHPEKLQAIRNKLLNNKSTAPLFNTKLFVQQFETALKKAWNNYLLSKKEDIYIK